jgi:hypothetical protein
MNAKVVFFGSAEAYLKKMKVHTFTYNMDISRDTVQRLRHGNPQVAKIRIVKNK